MYANYRILIIDESDERAQVLEAGLRDVEHGEIVRLRDMTDLVERIADIDPDVILVDLENPNRDGIEQMFRVSAVVKRPIAMFVNESNIEITRRAMRAGVSAYIVNDLASERIKPIIDTAVRRFEAYQNLENRAVISEQARLERKVIDQAKGIVMQRKNMPENEAYALIRKSARQKGCRLVDIAESIVMSDEIGV